MSTPVTPQQTAVDEGEPLTVAMTRPTMVGGFTLSSIGLSVLLPLYITFITRWLWALGACPILLVICYLICLKDIYLFDIALSASRLKACANKRIWRCRSYAPR
ncbi:VirB3 family type IV secretion system protein [Budviciaceae bacterium CWB-B4]|uniref:VirB3 family type IV secretion system protein n=1 Tax=Limnobaculum xujianqingii TaxID=2738837 RepID=A0A9D7FQA4_9GAMM|nr:VirB3 family type IV secretion system protein [Limnobaculum xujianqingii]MBK5071609.1 VirB3 family type IV secretion system protein [Limnobaculum xujianqingii]MBK5174918.1 VirB3 family type IV secretion system protein [Limnobaculum xujianqingii]